MHLFAKIKILRTGRQRAQHGMNRLRLGTVALSALLLLATSCATILNRKTCNVRFTSAGANDMIEIDENTYPLPGSVRVQRSKEDLNVKLITDTASINYSIRSSPNVQFLFYNLFWFSVAPAAYAIDLTNQRRFYYGHTIHLDPRDSARTITPGIRRRFENYFRKQYPSRRGDVNVMFTHSLFNHFYFSPEGESVKTAIGYLGLSAGISCFYKDNRYVAFSLHGITDLETPFPVPIDYDGYYESLSSLYFTLTDHHKFNRLHLGYGVSFAFNASSANYSGRFGPPRPGQDQFNKVNKSFGVTFNGYYYLSPRFFIGAVYTPSLFRMSPTTKFHYEHIVSISGGIKLDVGAKKNLSN